MRIEQALEVFEKAKAMIDTAVFHDGSFGNHVLYERAKAMRHEYKSAVRTLKIHLKSTKGSEE